MRPERSRSRWLFAVSLASSMAGFGVRLPADDAEIVREWVFDSDEKAQGWEAGNGISGLHVAKGKLVGQIEDPDAYLFGPPVQVPMNGLVLKVRWSCPKSGSGQCYFATDQSPRMGEDKVVSRNVPGGEVVETDFSLDADGRAKPTLTRFRLDPFNGLKGVPFEIEKVVLLRLPCRLEIVFGPAKSVARPGEPVELKLWLRHSGGRRPEGTMEAVVDHPDGADLKIRIDAGSESPSGSCAIAFKKPGVHVVRARVFQDGRETRELESSIVVGVPEAPAAPLLESQWVGLELLPSSLNA